MRNAWNVAAFLVLAALCFAAYDVLRTPHPIERHVANTVAAQPTESARAADPTPPVRSKEVPVSRPAPRTLKQQFFETTDLADFVARQAANANQGDGQAALYIAKSYQECMPFGKDPNAYVWTMREVVKPLFRSTSDIQAFDAMMQREVSRCSALNQSPQRQKAMQDWLRRGAEQGNLSARIARLVSAQTFAPDEMQDILGQLIRSKDGEAISEIGPMMGLASADELTTFKDFAGGEDSAYVWQLAGCSFGADCSRSSDILRGMCASAGLCTFNSLEEAYSQILPPIEFEQVRKMRDALVLALNKGE